MDIVPPLTRNARQTRTVEQLTNVEHSRHVAEEVVILFFINVTNLIPHSTQAFGTTPTVTHWVKQPLTAPSALVPAPAAFNSMKDGKKFREAYFYCSKNYCQMS